MSHGQACDFTGSWTKGHLLVVHFQLKNLVAWQTLAEADQARGIQPRAGYVCQVNSPVLLRPVAPTATWRKTAAGPVERQPGKPAMAEPPVGAGTSKNVARKLLEQSKSGQRQGEKKKQLDNAKQAIIECGSLQAVDQCNGQCKVPCPRREVQEPVQRTPPLLPCRIRNPGFRRRH
jgi:hypothetical protein